MRTIHKFTQEEAIKALREKHKLAQEDMIEIESPVSSFTYGNGSVVPLTGGGTTYFGEVKF